MHFPNEPLIPVERYAQKIARSIRDVTAGDYFIKTSREEIGSGQISHINVASVYRRRPYWGPKCVAKVSNTVPIRGGSGTVDIKFYGVESKKLEVMIENMRTMHLG